MRPRLRIASDTGRGLRVTFAVLLVGAVLAAVGGCGQRGPLFLPDDGAVGGAGAGASGASGAAARDDGDDEDDEDDERDER